MVAVEEGCTFEIVVAPAGPRNPRNSEADIIALEDGSLLLGWTEFYAGDGGDAAPAQIVGRVSFDGGSTWGEKYTERVSFHRRIRRPICR